MAAVTNSQVSRLVRCPQCQNVLREPPNVIFYMCGGCKITLEAQVQASSRQHVYMKQDFGILRKMLQDPCAIPICLPLDFLKSITCDFSEEQELGRGGYGVVYKGVLQNGKAIAVKKLSEMHLEDDQFQKEVTYLVGLKHHNIVQLVGYCAESRWEAAALNEKYVLAEVRKRLLCFEYVNNKSLDKHLSGETTGLDWPTRYEIIRGICCGLNYLHTECHIVHLDLKPENILLDDLMVPKIADFGMSKLFGQQQSRIITERRGGTLGYMAPEYLQYGLISTKADIFSLGVIIIELITGRRVYPDSEASFEHFIESVAKNWENRFEQAPRYIPMEICSLQVKTCMETGMKCVDRDLERRPTAWNIIEQLIAVDVEAVTINRCLGMNGWQPVGKDLQTGRSFSISSTGYSSSSDEELEFDILFPLRTSTMFKGRQLGILAFEVANTVVKGSSLVNTLYKLRMKNLGEGVLRSEGVCHLISEDQNQLLILFEADIRDEFRKFSTEVARFGKWCSDPRWHCLDIYFSRLQSELTPRKHSNEVSLMKNLQYLIRLAQLTSKLYQEMRSLDKVYKTITARNEIRSSAKRQRNVVKNLKRKSFWSKTVEHVLERLVGIVHFMHLEINYRAFFKSHEDQTPKPTIRPIETLGSTGLALHYGNVIFQINTMYCRALASSPAILEEPWDAVYKALPRCIRSKLRGCCSIDKMTVEEVRAEMESILQWIVPVAESTRLYYKNGAFGEWEMKGMEDVYVDEPHLPTQEGCQIDEAQLAGEEECQTMASAMLVREKAKVNKIETLYYADKETTEVYIVELVRALRRLLTCQSRK